MRWAQERVQRLEIRSAHVEDQLQAAYEELRELDRFVRNHTTERFGPVRAVAPKLVVEVAFEGVNSSARHKSGVAMRFPRISRIRWDKPAGEADRLETLAAMIDTPNAFDAETARAGTRDHPVGEPLQPRVDISGGVGLQAGRIQHGAERRLRDGIDAIVGCQRHAGIVALQSQYECGCGASRR